MSNQICNKNSIYIEELNEIFSFVQIEKDFKQITSFMSEKELLKLLNYLDKENKDMKYIYIQNILNKS